MENSLVYSSGNSGGTYLYSTLYNAYIESKIENEEALARQLSQYIPVNEAAYNNIRVITEAKAMEKIKNKMQKALQFIKNLFGKFMESMTNILLAEKDYLEKYQNIILKKTPKESLEYSYSGDYSKAIQRCINTTVPVFNYQTHAAALKKEGDADIVKLIMQGKEFTYDSEETLATQFKEYFLASENGKESTGKFTDLNFTNLYNFCHDFKKIETITKKDQNYIRQSTDQIIAAANQKIKDATSTSTTNPQQPASPATNSESDNGAEAKPESNNGAETPTVSEEKESFRFAYGTYFTEDGDDDKKSTGVDIKDTSKGDTPNDISTTASKSAVSQMATTDRASVDDAMKAKSIEGSGEETEKSMLDMGDKYARICQTLVAAKCTAVQQIAKDYMAIIRAHVRSYVGNDDKKEDDRTKRSGDTYQKDNNQQSNNQQSNNQNQQTEPEAPQESSLVQQVRAILNDDKKNISKDIIEYQLKQTNNNVKKTAKNINKSK